jgi:hypothetical protein
MRVSLLGLGEDWFVELLAERSDDLHDAPAAGSDLVFFRVERAEELGRLSDLRHLIKEEGAIWVLRTKGAGRTVTEHDIIQAAARGGLVDNKIASFSDRLGAMRLVIRVKDRRPSGGLAPATSPTRRED